MAYFSVKLPTAPGNAWLGHINEAKSIRSRGILILNESHPINLLEHPRNYMKYLFSFANEMINSYTNMDTHGNGDQALPLISTVSIKDPFYCINATQKRLEGLLLCTFY